jgi:hypothetical protein
MVHVSGVVRAFLFFSEWDVEGVAAAPPRKDVDVDDVEVDDQRSRTPNKPLCDLLAKASELHMTTQKTVATTAHVCLAVFPVGVTVM